MPKRNQHRGDPPENGDPQRVLYCLVPDDKPRLRELLDRHYRHFDQIRVVAERRGLDRRSGIDRRRGAGERRAEERRRTNPEPERRSGRRRADARPVKPPVLLPPEADRYIDQIVFVERVE